MSNFENCKYYLKVINKYTRDIKSCKNIIRSFENKNSDINLEYYKSLLNYKINKFENLKNLFFENYNNINNKKQKHEIFIKTFKCYIYINNGNEETRDLERIYIKDITKDILLSDKY